MNQIGTGIGDFLRWWGGQLRDFVPAASAGQGGTAGPRLVLEVAGGRASLVREAGGNVAAVGANAGEGVGPDAVAVLLAGADTAGLPVGIRVPLSDCLIRQVELPAEARARFADILRLDLERATPFRAGDVLTDFIVPTGRPTGPMVTVRQVVLRRDKVAPWVAALERLGRPAAFIDCFDTANGEAVAVNLLAQDARQQAGPSRTGLRAALLAACLLLAVGGVWTWTSRLGAALASLQAETAAAREKAVKAQRSLDGAFGTLGDLGALRQLTTGPVSVTEVLETLTRLIPDQAWLQDIRIEGGTIELTGLAQNAAALLPLLERSAIFTEASFTAPVLLDPTAGKERFSIRLRVRRAAADATAPGPAGAKP